MTPATLKDAPSPYQGTFPAPSATFFADVERENGAHVIGWRWIAETVEPGRWEPAGVLVVLADSLLYFNLCADGTPDLCYRASTLHAPTAEELA